MKNTLKLLINNTIIGIVSLCLILPISYPSHAASPLKAEQFVLQNGLEVVIVEQHQAPVVSHMLWFRLGAADEPAGQSGVAHYLEHLLFKGTPTVPDGEYDKQIERIGGQKNAFTGQDYTGYYVTIAKENLEKVMMLEADRMQFLSPPKESFAKELQVVIEERRSRIDNNPGALLNEQMKKQLFEGHPYSIPIIGWMDEIKKLTEKEAMGFYEQYYHPANAVLVLVGDITRAEVEPLIEKHYGKWETGQPYHSHWPEPTPLKMSHTLRMEHVNVVQPQWMRLYRAPSLAKDIYNHTFALMVLSDLLGNGRASYLYQRLVKKDVKATKVSVYYNPFQKGQSVFGLTALPAENVSIEALNRAMEKALNDFMESEIDAKQLVGIKNRMKAETIYARDGIEALAYLFGQLYMLGLSADFITEWPERIEAVTAEDIKDAMRNIVTEKDYVQGYLLPQSKPQVQEEVK